MAFVSIAGTVGKDAEVREAGNSTVCNFSVAESGYDFKARQKTTTWFRVSIWGKRATTLGPLLTKGSKVALSGELSLREYNGKTSIEIKAQDVTLLGGGKPKEERPAQEDAPSFGGYPAGDDDIPF